MISVLRIFSSRLLVLLVAIALLSTISAPAASAASNDPNIVSDTSSLTLTNPSSEVIEVYSDDLPLGAHDVTAISSDENIATIESNGPTVGNIASFTVKSVSRGITSVIFSLTVTNDDFSETHYNNLRVKVTVNAPAMNSYPDSLSGYAGANSTIEITSGDMPFAPGTLLHVVSLNPGVASVAVPDVAVSDDGSAAFEIHGVSYGSTAIRFSADGYTNLTVPIAIGKPGLVTDKTALDVTVGNTTQVDVTSTDALFDDPETVTATSSRNDVVAIADAVPGETTDTARFALTGLTAGSTIVVFHKPGYADSSPITVNVSNSAFIFSPLPEMIIAGSIQTFEVTSAETALDSTAGIDIQSSNENVATATVSSPIDGVALVTLNAIAPGAAKLTVTAPGYAEHSIDIFVGTPSLVASDSIISLFSLGKATVSIECPDLLTNGSKVSAEVVGSVGVATTQEFVSCVDGFAEFEISGITKGRTTIRFSADNCNPTDVEVKVSASQLFMSDSSLELFVGETKTINLYSIDGIEIPKDFEFPNWSNDHVSFQSTYAGDGTFNFQITGLAEGSTSVPFSLADENIFSAPKLPSSITVKSPALISDSNNLNIFTGASQKVLLTSTDLQLTPASAITHVGCEGGNVIVDSTSNATAGTVTISVKGVSEGTCDLQFSADNYQSVSVRFTVKVPKLSTVLSTILISVGEAALIPVSSDDFALDDRANVSAVTASTGYFTIDSSATSRGGTGTFLLLGKSPGRDEVTFSAVGYQSLVFTVVVVAAPITNTVTTAPSSTEAPSRLTIGSTFFTSKQVTLSLKDKLLLKRYAALIKAKKFKHVTLTSFLVYVPTKSNKAAGIRATKLRIGAVKSFLQILLPGGTKFVILDGTKKARKGYLKTQTGRDEYRRIDITANK